MSTPPTGAGIPDTTHKGSDRGPLVVACLRICDLRAEVDPLTGSVTSDGFGLALSAADGAALEHALRLAEAWSGRVLAAASGPATIDPVLRSVAALGVRVLRVGDEPGGPIAGGPIAGGPIAGGPAATAGELAADEHGLAAAIAAALAPLGPVAAVLCGDRSPDRGTGAMPAFLAHELGAAQALGLVSVRPDDDAAGSGHPALVAERRLDGGWRERLRVPLPAVCSVEAAGVRLRTAPLAGSLAVESLNVPTTPGRHRGEPPGGAVRVGAPRPYSPPTRVVPPPVGDDPRLRILTLTGALVAHEPPTLVGPVGADEAADHLLEFLARHGYVEPDPEEAL